MTVSFVVDLGWPPAFSKTQNEPESIRLAVLERALAGFGGLRLDPDDWMGAIYIIAASPDHQRKRISKALMRHAEDKIDAFGAKMIMIEIIRDSGHEGACHAYEAFAFERWPVAGY